MTDIDMPGLYRELGGINAQLADISTDITEIKKQVTRTNGRVNKHEQEIATLASQGVADRLMVLEKERLVAAGIKSNKQETLKGRWAVIGVTVGLFGGAGLVIIRELVTFLAS
jgi:hypothetical protein